MYRILSHINTIRLERQKFDYKIEITYVFLSIKHLPRLALYISDFISDVFNIVSYE